MHKAGRNLFAISAFFMLMCSPVILTGNTYGQAEPVYNDSVITGAERTSLYLPLLNGKKVAVAGNQTSVVGSKTHLVDTLLAMGVEIVKVFAPEHGFRGTADAGEKVKDSKDVKTGLPILSLYGKDKKPSSEKLRDVDVIIFDMQDVGARFYTYISTMHYLMEAAAEHQVPVIIFDRPNPNGFYVDGPVLEKKYSSFIGLHPVPVIHGMTIGEYAQMINEEGWLENDIKCDLTVISCKNYSHKDFYKLPVKPSPNLPNMSAIFLYPSVCFFEGTQISLGRGTAKPFQMIGFPGYSGGDTIFTPVSMEGAKQPKHKGQECSGYDLSEFGKKYMPQCGKLYLFWLIGMYEQYPDKKNFFRKDGFFNLLAGNATLKQQIIDGVKEEDIRASWEEDIKAFKKIRKKYLLYEDFED